LKCEGIGTMRAPEAREHGVTVLSEDDWLAMVGSA